MPLPFALDHINLWLLEEQRRLHARRLRLRRRADARAVGAAFRDDARRRADRAHRRHALPPGPPRQRRVARRRASAARSTMTQAEYLTAHAIVERARGARAGRHLRALPPPRHGRRARRRARRRAATLPPRRARAAARRSSGMHRRRHGRRRRARVAGDRRLRPFAGARGAATRRARRADLRRHAAAADHHQRQPCGRPIPTAIRSARFLDSLDAFEALPPRHAGAAVARPAVSRHRRCASRSCARITPRGSPSCSDARRGRAAPQSRRATSCPVLFRRELDLQQRFFAMGEAIAHLNHLWRARPRSSARVAADGAIRFAA